MAPHSAGASPSPSPRLLLQAPLLTTTPTLAAGIRPSPSGPLRQLAPVLLFWSLGTATPQFIHPSPGFPFAPTSLNSHGEEAGPGRWAACDHPWTPPSTHVMRSHVVQVAPGALWARAMQTEA